MTVAHRRTLRSLQLGTALATTLFAGTLATPAFAQALPVVTTGGEGGATITTNAADQQINLNDANRVIDFDSYNVAAGNTVNYLTNSTTNQYAVLNRVVVISPANQSLIDGSITGQSNIAVWLSNPNGILVGPSGSFNTGGLVLTTLNVDPTAFLATGGAAEGGAFSLTGGTGTITIGGALTTTGSGGLVGTLLVASPQIAVNRTSATAGKITASGTAALVAASDATFSAGIGSPLSVTITAGSVIADGESLIDVADSSGDAAATISGESVALVGASDSTVMGALLNVGSGASLTATGANGAVILATKDVASIAMPENGDDIVVNGSLAATGMNGTVDLASAGDITVSDASLDVTTANADGSLSLTATAGDLTLGTGSAGGTATLAATGTAQMSVTGSLTSVGSQTLTLTGTGNVSANSLTTTGAGSDISVTSGSVSVTSASAMDALNLTATNGDVSLGTGTAGGSFALETQAGVGNVFVTGGVSGGAASSIVSVNNAQVASASTSAGDLTVSAAGSVTGFGAGDANLAAGAALTVTAGPLARLGMTSAGTDIVVTGDAVSIDSATAGGLLSLAADVGDLTLGGGSAGTTATLDAADQMFLGGGVSAGGALSLTAANGVVLTGNATLAGSSIAVNNAIDAQTTGGQSLTLNSAGATTLQNVGATTALASIATDAGGTTALNGGTITTTGAQNFGDTVVLNTSVTATGSTGTAAAVVGNNNDLTLNYTGLTFINGNLTGVNDLVTGNGGTTALSGIITTSGMQTYGEAVSLAGATTLNAGGGGVLFGSTLDGAQTLAVNTSGVTNFAGAVGNATPLTSLTTDVGGSTLIGGGSVTTSGAQAYNDSLSLSANTTLTGGSGSFQVINGGGNDLTLNFGGTTTLDGAFIAGIDDLTTGGGGDTALSGTITTTGAQVYNDAVNLTGATVLNAGAGDTIDFVSTVNGGQTLAVNTTGATIFRGAVGAAMGGALTSLTTDTGGTTTIHGGSVTTSGAQTYNDNVVLSADATLASSGAGAIAFAGTVNSQDMTARALTVNTTGVTSFGGGVGTTAQLASLTTDAGGTTAINGGAITTSGAQSFGDAVTLGANTTLTGTTGTFAAGLTGGGFDLTLDYSALTTLDGTFTGIKDLTTGNGGTTELSGTIVTTGKQTYNDSVSLTGATVLTSSGAGAAGDVTFGSTLNGAQTLAINTAGDTLFSGAVGAAMGGALTSLTTDAPGVTRLRGGTVRTSGAQTYNDDVLLGAATILTSTGGGDIAFGKTINSEDATARALTVNTGGATSFGGGVGTTATLASLTTDAGGTTALNGGIVTTTGAQTYNDAVTLGAATTLNATANGNITFVSTLNGAQTLSLNTNGVTAFGGAVGGMTALTSLTTDVGGTTALNGGSVATTGAQTYNDSVALGAATTLTSMGAGNIAFGSALNGAQALAVNTGGITTFAANVGQTAALTSLTTDATGTTVLSGATVTTSGGQTYGDAVTLAAQLTLTSTGGGTIDFVSTLNGGHALDVNTAGLTIFRGAVGGAPGSPLTSLTTDAPGTTTIHGGSVTSTGAQTYNDDVTLSADTVLSANALTFNGTVGGAFALTANVANATTFGNAVGDTVNLASLTTNAGGSTVLNGGSVTTTGAQTYGDAVVLGANTTLTGGSGSFAAGLNGATFDLTLNFGGTTTLNGTFVNIDDLTTGGGGDTTLSGTITTIGAQVYNDAVNLTGATVLNAGAGDAITFANTVDGGQTLALNTSGVTTFLAPVGTGTALTSITTDAAGETDLNGGPVITTGAQTYNDAVVLTIDTTLTSTGGDTIGFASTVNSDATARALTVNTTGTTSFAGAVGGGSALASLATNAGGTTSIGGGLVNTTGTQQFGDAVTLTNATTLTSSGAGAAGDITLASTTDGAQTLTVNTAGTTSFGGAVGATTALTSLTTDAPGSTGINGGSVRTSGAQTYGDAVLLGAATTLTSTGSGTIDLASTVNGAQTLAVNTGGLTIFRGAVGGSTPLTSLTTDAPGTMQMHAGTVTTTGAQTYNDPVVLSADTTLTSTGMGTVAFAQTVDSDATARALAVNTGGTTSFGGTVGAGSALSTLTTDGGGTTAINGGAITTTGAQAFGDAVTLGTNTTLTGTTGSFAAGLMGNGFDLTLNYSGATNIDGSFTGIDELTTGNGGTTTLSGTITTGGGQTYNDAVTLGGATTLASTGAGAIDFVNTVNGGQTLAVNTGGLTIFRAPVGAMAALASLTTDAAGSTTIHGGSVTTTGAQTYNDAVTLSADATLTSTGAGAITLASTVNSDATARALTVNTSGTSTFGGAVGATNALSSLTTDAPGSTALNGGAVNTIGAQSYSDATTLGAATTLTSTGAGAVAFASTLDGGQTLAVNTAGATTFGGAVGTGTALTSLTTDAPGSTAINGGAVTTTGAQTYNDAATLGANTTLTSTSGGNLTFGSTLNGPFALNANTAGSTVLLGIVGGTAALASLSTDAAGDTDLNGSAVTTTGAQAYNDAVTLSADTTLTSTMGGAISFAQTVDSDATARSLTVNTVGTTSFGGSVGATSALSALTSNVGGTTAINGGSVRTSGAQTYNDAVALGAATTLTSTAGGNLTFGSTLNGPFALAANTSGSTVFLGAVGGTAALASLTTDAGGETDLNGGPVTTTGAQTYNDAVVLTTDTTLTSTGGGNVAFAQTVNSDGTPRALAVNTGGTTSFGGAVGGVSALASLTTDAAGATAINGGSVTTTGAQTFNDAVTLGANTALTSTGGGNLTFGSTLNGAFALNANTAGATVFQGVVGGTAALASLTTDAAGSTAINGGAVTTSGAQTYNDPVTLGANTTLTITGGGNVAFAGTVNADATARSLTVNTAGVTSFGGAVGGASALASLTTDAGGSTALNGGSVTTTGGQTYGDAVMLGAATTLTSTGSGTIDFANTLDGGQTLAVNTSGLTIFRGAVGGATALTSLTTDTDGTTTIHGGSVMTTGAQSYGDAVTLSADATLTSTGGGNVAFAQTLDSDGTPRGLAVNTSGVTSFSGAVGGGSALSSLTTNAGGSTAINGGTVTTTGSQIYGDAVALGANTTLTSTGNGSLDFGSTLDGAFALTLNTGGLTIFRGAVGSSSPLVSLTTDAPGTTTIHGGSVTTTGAQTYNDAVTLSANATLTSTGSGNVAFASTVNSDATARALAVNTGGTTSFGGAVGGTSALASLTTDAAGSTAINGGAVTTTGAQTYNDATTLGANTTLTSTGGGNLTFGSTLNGPFALNANTVGTTVFQGVVGGTAALASLTTDAPGSTLINGGAITTTGGQTYNDAVTLGANTTLTSTGNGSLDFGSTVNGARTLALNTGGLTIFRGAVGGTTALSSLTTDSGGTTTIHGGSVTTTGAQTYNDAVTLSADTTLTSTGAGNVAFATTLDGAQALTVNTAGTTRFGGAVGGTTALASLTTDAPGATAINGGSVATSGAQTYNDPVTLGADTTLNAGTDIVFAAALNSLDGTQGLSATAGGAANFNGVTGGVQPLESLTVSAASSIIVDGTVTNAAQVTTTGTIQIGSLTAGSIAISGGQVTGLGAGNANLAATAGDVSVTAGTLARLGTVSASGVGSDIVVTGDVISVDNATAGGLLSLAADVGNLTLGTGNAGTTASLAADGDIVLTSKLVAGGNISLAAGDDVTIAAYDASADTGLIRSTSGDVTVDADGSVHGIGGAENGLPTAQRGIAALTTNGNLTINSDGDARFDSLGATGSIALNIAGSLTGSPLSGGSATGTNVPGGAIFATGAGGDVTIRSGLAGAPSIDVVVLNRVIADRNISISADQLAIGTLTTNSGTITLNDTSGAALTADNYYVGMLNAAGDLVVVLTGQPTAAIPLVATDAGGAPESFDAAFGKADLSAGTSLTGTIGQAAQLGDVSFGTTLDLDTAALVADTLSSTGGNADILASTGTLAVLTTSLGGPLTLTKQGGSAATAGDELRLRNVTTGGDATLTSSTHQRIGSLSSGSNVTISAVNDLTGLLGASTGTSDAGFGRADLAASGSSTMTLGGLAQLGTASAGSTLSVTAGDAASDGSIDVTTAQAGTDLSLVARANAPVADAAHDGDVLIGTATAGTTLLVSNVVTGGDSGNVVASGALQAGGDTRIDAANDATLASVTTTGGSLGLRARRDAATGSLTASEDIGVAAGRNASLGALNAGDDILVTAGGTLTVASATASGAGPDGRTVSFASPTTIAFPAETNPGADIVFSSTGSSVTANGPVTAASDVTVGAATSVAHLSTTTATSGNVTVTSGTSTQLVGDVTSGIDTTVNAGTTAAIQQNVTAGGNYTVTAGTGITLGDANARTQQANGSVAITATSGDVAKGAGRLTIISNADQVGTEALTINAVNGNIVLANSQLTGGSLAGRESDVVLSASGAITADDLDGDRVGMTAGGNIVADTIEAGTGAADSGDLADRQSIDLVSTGGSVTVNTAQAFGAGHDIDIRAANALTANSLNAGGSLVGRAGQAIAVGTATAGEDVALRSNGSRITITGATSAGDDVLLTAAGAIATGSVTASGTGPDTRTVTFGAGALDAAYAAETNPGADIVINSTGSSTTANGAVTAASDVTVNAATSVAHLATTTATSGNVTVTSGTSTQLVGDVTSGINTSVNAGTTAAIQQNVTAGGNYTVTAGTGVTLGDASARTQQANGSVAITATSGDVAQGVGRLTVISNADQIGTETLTLTASNGNIVLANSQLTGRSLAGRESDVVLSASGAITADDLDGDRVGFTAGGNIIADTIEAGTGAADSGDLADRQSIDLVSSGGSVTVNTAQAFGAGHDIDIRAANALNANSLNAGGTIVGRAGQAIAIGTATAGEDVALKSNNSSITITGATTAGDDVLLTAAGAIAAGSVTATGSGPDTRTVLFGAGALDAAYAAETNPGADIVITSTGSSTTANGAVSAASDVTVNAATSVTHLSSTTATAGNVTVTSGTSTQLVGDVVSGINTTVTAGTTAAIQQNVTAGGNYTVTGGTGVTLGDAAARTQQANGNVTITATNGDVSKGAGRLTVVANADRTAANNAEALTINAVNGNIVLANSQLSGGSTAGRESDIRLTARGITVGKVDGASLTARATTGFSANEAIVAGNAARGADPVNGASAVDIAVTGGGLTFTDITATNTGHDVTLNASGAISGNTITAARTVLVNGGSVAVSGATTATANSVTVNGGASASLGSLSAATTGAVTAGTINVGTAITGSTLNLNATGSTLTLGSATSGGDVTLAAATRATLGPITATGRNVTLSAMDADVNGNIAATRIDVIDRAAGANPLRLGDAAPGTGGFALSQAEFNRLNAATVVLDAGTSGGGARQDVAIGALAIDADTGSTRLDILGQQRFDVTGTIGAMGNGARTFRFGGSAADGTRATTMRFATTADGGGRVLVPGIALDLRADRIGMGFDATFLASIGLTPGGTPLDPTTVAGQYIANGGSTLYNSDAFGAGTYSNQTILTADSLTVRYADYALFQNTGGTAANSGADLASLSDPSAPALILMGPNPPDAGGFALFGTINGVPDSAAAVLGDQIITLTAVDRLNARVNGCLIGSGSGCIASTTSQPPLPPLNAFRGDIFSSQGDLSIPFDPVVGTNNESLFGDVGSFGLSDLPLQPLECDPEEEGTCPTETEETSQ